jgi:plastocyanin
MKSSTNFAITVVILAIIVAIMLLVVFGPLSVQPGRNEQIRSLKSLESTYTVTIQNGSFDPTYLTVLAGTTVTWNVPADNAQVNGVYSDRFVNSTRMFDSGTIQAGDSFSFTFNEVGNYSYHSGIQYYLIGYVNVIPNAPESLEPANQPVVPQGYPTVAGRLSLPM